MTSSANSTPSIDNDSITNIKSTSNPYSYSNSNRQGSISTLWSSAELPFFLDSRSNQHLHSSPNSNHISNHHHASNNNSGRPSISGSLTSNYALDRDRGSSLSDRYGLGMALGNGAGTSNGSSSSGGRPSISSEFSLNFTSRKDSKGEDESDGDRRKEDFEELDDHPQSERERERRSSPSSYNHQISNRSREKERESEDHHPYPFSGPESSFTDLNSSRDLHSFSSPSTSSSPPKHLEIQNTTSSSSSTASNRPKQSQDQDSSLSSSSNQHSSNDKPTTNQRSFSSNFDSPKKEKELRGYQKRRPNHLGLNLPSSSSTSSSSHQSKPSETDSSFPKNSPRRDISAPSMPISVSYGSQLSSVYGLNSSKDGHSPIFNHGSESIPPIPSSPLLFSSNEHHQQGENLENFNHGLKVPGLECDLSSRSSTSGSTLISPITPHTNLPSVPLPTKKKSKKPALTHEQLYKRANKLFDSNYTVESPNASVEIGEDYMDQTVVEHNEGDNSNEISNTSNGSGNTSNSYEAPLGHFQEMEQDFNHQDQSPSFNASETILHRQISHSSVRTGNSGNGSASYISVFTDDGSQGTGRNGNGDASLTGTPFSRISQLDDNHTSSSSDFSPASSNLPELDSHSNYSYSNNSSKNGVLRNHYENHEYQQGITPTKEISLEFQAPRLSNKPSISSNHSNRVFHGTSTSSLGRTAIMNQSQISLSPRKSSFLPLSPTYPNSNQLNGRSPPISPRRPPSSPGRMNGNSPSFNLLGGPPLSPSKKSMRPSTANTMVQSNFNHQNGSVSSQNSSSLGLQVSPNHPYRSMIEAGLPPTLSAENLIKSDSSTSSASTNHSSSSNAGSFTKRLRAVSTSSRLKVLPNWNNIFSSSSKEPNSKENKDLDIGILACDSPTQLSINGSSSMHSGSVSNGPSSPVSMNRIPLPLSSQNSQSTSQVDGKGRNRPVSERRSPPPANASGTFTTSTSTSGITGPLGRFRSRTLGSADRRPSSSQASSSMPGFQPPSPTALVQNLPSYPPSASKSGTMNLKSLRRPSKTDTLNSSINGGNRTPSISLSTSERGSGIFGYESSGGGSSKRNSSNQKESNKSQSNSNDASKASLPPKSPSSNRNSSRPKSKGGWASHLAAGLTLHLTSESLDGIPSSRGCQVIMNYMYYDPFGKPESLVPKDQYPRPTTPKKSKFRNGEKGNEKEEEKESAEDTSGILEFSPKPFEETSTTKFSESDEFCFSINSSLILKHLTIGNDLKGDLISRQATISLANLGTHSVSGLERKGKLAWRFVYAVEDRSIMIENESSGVFEKVNIRGERKLRPISFQCSSTLLDPSRARKSRLITMVKKSVGSQITSTKVGGDREFSESPSSSKADLSAINNQSVGSLSIPPSPGYSIHQNGPKPQSSFNRKPSDSSLKRQANPSGWNPPPNLVPFRMTRPSVAPSNSTANTSNSSNRSSAASQHPSQSPHHQHQPLPSSPSRSHYPPSASQNHEGIVTRRRGASLGEASRANPIGLLNGNHDGTNQTLRSVSGNSGSVGKGNSTSRNRPSMTRRITAERELPTLPASSSPGPHHPDPSSSRYSEKAPPSSPFRSKAYEEDYGLSPKSVPDSLPVASVRRERDPNRPPTASESIKLEYLSRDSDAARANGRFVSNPNQGLNDRSVSISNLKDSFNNQLDARRERSKTHEDSSSSSFDYGMRSSSNPQPFDLNEIQSQANSQRFNLKSMRRPDTAQPLLSPTKDEFFQQSNPKKSNSLLLAPFQMKEKSKNKTQEPSNQNVKKLKNKSSFKSFSSGHKKSSQRARTATAEPRTGALLVEMGWI